MRVFCLTIFFVDSIQRIKLRCLTSQCFHENGKGRIENNGNQEKGNEEGCEEVQEALTWTFDPYRKGTRKRPLWFWVEQAFRPGCKVLSDFGSGHQPVMCRRSHDLACSEDMNQGTTSQFAETPYHEPFG